MPFWVDVWLEKLVQTAMMMSSALVVVRLADCVVLLLALPACPSSASAIYAASPVVRADLPIICLSSAAAGCRSRSDRRARRGLGSGRARRLRPASTLSNTLPRGLGQA